MVCYSTHYTKAQYIATCSPKSSAWFWRWQNFCIMLYHTSGGSRNWRKGAREGGLGGLAPQVRGSGGSAPNGSAGAEPLLGVWERSPQKLKPKNSLDASRKAFGDAECQVCPSEPTLNFCIILVLVGMLQPVCRPLNLLEYRPKTEYHTGNGKTITSLLYCSSTVKLTKNLHTPPPKGGGACPLRPSLSLYNNWRSVPTSWTDFTSPSLCT